MIESVRPLISDPKTVQLLDSIRSKALEINARVPGIASLSDNLLNSDWYLRISNNYRTQVLGYLTQVRPQILKALKSGGLKMAKGALKRINFKIKYATRKQRRQKRSLKKLRSEARSILKALSKNASIAQLAAKVKRLKQIVIEVGKIKTGTFVPIDTSQVRRKLSFHQRISSLIKRNLSRIKDRLGRGITRVVIKMKMDSDGNLAVSVSAGGNSNLAGFIRRLIVNNKRYLFNRTGPGTYSYRSTFSSMQ